MYLKNVFTRPIFIKLIPQHELCMLASAETSPFWVRKPD